MNDADCKSDASAVGSLALFGFFMQPDFIGVPLLVGTAKYHNGKWLCRDLTTGRNAEVATKAAAAQWIQAWSKAYFIAEGTEYKPNASAMAIRRRKPNQSKQTI